MTFKEPIVQASRSGDLVRVSRNGLEDGWAVGYVAAVGDEFFALELIGKSIWFDGFSCMRYVDITEFIYPAPHSEFVSKALSLRGLRRRGSLAIDLSSLTSLLETAAEIFPVLVVHTEVSEPNICFIGKISEVSGDKFSLILVTPDGTWESKASWFDLTEITRVDFGGGYEEALFVVAGQPI